MVMPETNEGTRTVGTPLWRRRGFWLGGGAVLAGLAGLAAVTPQVWANAVGGHGFGHGHGFGGHGPRGFAAQILKDPDGAKRHAGMALEWVLRGVDATDEQKQQAKRIADRLVDQLGPVAAKHQEQRHSIGQELAKPQIDREALDRLRRSELALADEASKIAVEAFADLAETLTAEQRQELISFAGRFHHGS
jgi:Spy/CpxP family protein refolding chaperone